MSACQQPPAPKETAATTKPTAAATASPTASPSASPTTKTPESAPDKSPATAASLDKVAGEYTVVLDPKVLADAEKEGVKSVTGKWTIKPEGTFEATLKAVSTKDEVQEIKTAGKISIKDGKVVSQVESVNGEKPPQAPPEQPYTLSNRLKISSPLPGFERSPFPVWGCEILSFFQHLPLSREANDEKITLYSGSLGSRVDEERS